MCCAFSMGAAMAPARGTCMTTAVCFKCGAMKFGAWFPCEACGKTPSTEDDLITSLALSDHHYDLITLTKLSDHIAAGREIELDAPSRVALGAHVRRLRRITTAIGLSEAALPPSRLAATDDPGTPLAGQPECDGNRESERRDQTDAFDNARRGWEFPNQPRCGTVRFEQNGKTSVIAVPDYTALHFLGHIAVRTLRERLSRPTLSDEEWENISRQVERWLGIERGIWTHDQEESFVEEFEALAAKRTGNVFSPQRRVSQEATLAPAITEMFEGILRTFPPK
jgi:hypothetical protein